MCLKDRCPGLVIPIDSSIGCVASSACETSCRVLFLIVNSSDFTGTAATTRPVEPLPSKRSAKKRPASDSFAATGQGGLSEAIAGTHSAEPPQKKTVKKKKMTADGTVAEDQTGLNEEHTGLKDRCPGLVIPIDSSIGCVARSACEPSCRVLFLIVNSSDFTGLV
ncbi:hypothetical protein DY000_02048228 [Brassica cretica]|uniref:Uncharacterized protein n=1 Tax=Brassica cretica TaxID=69181 RepID=A0ABQ7EVH7_BRACR|nr:hypothetical protein DY000_02048228 [Brassica cretica]